MGGKKSKKKEKNRRLNAETRKKRTKIAGKRTYNAKISNDTRKRSSTRAFQMQAMNMTIGKGNEQ